MLPRFWRFRAAARKCFGNSGDVYPLPSSLSTISLASSINSPRCSLAILPNTIILSFFVLMETHARAGKEEYRSAQTLLRSAIASMRSAMSVRWGPIKLTRHDTASSRLAPLSSQSTHYAFLHFSVANRVQKLLHIGGIDTGSDDAVNIHAKSDTQQQHLQAVSSLPSDIDTEQGR